jgi:hypothetical protein
MIIQSAATPEGQKYDDYPNYHRLSWKYENKASQQDESYLGMEVKEH